MELMIYFHRPPSCEHLHPTSNDLFITFLDMSFMRTIFNSRITSRRNQRGAENRGKSEITTKSD